MADDNDDRFCNRRLCRSGDGSNPVGMEVERMSVLIRGMEMPKNGETITITICGDGLVFEEWKEPGSVFKAVPVPEHGRLIDADVLLEREWVHDYKYEGDPGKIKIYVEIDDIVSAVEDAPTIIPADEADMDSFIRIFEEDDEEDGMDSFIRILKD